MRPHRSGRLPLVVRRRRSRGGAARLRVAALDVADRLALTLRGYKGDGASEAGVEAELLASLRKVEKMKVRRSTIGDHC